MDEPQIREVEILEDGTKIFEVGSLVTESLIQDEDFYTNLAESYFDESALNKISSDIFEALEQDIAARSEWLGSIERVEKYLGFSIEDIDNVPFKEATRTFDSTLPTSLIRYFAVTRSELLPPSGPVGFVINGRSDEDLETKGEKLRDWLNYFLTQVDKGYYSDCEKFLLRLGFYGSGFKKVYEDKILNRPMVRAIAITDFIIDGDCSNILDSVRITHVLHLSKRDILLNQKNGLYRDVMLPYLKSGEDYDSDDSLLQPSEDIKPDVDKSVYSKKSLFDIYECHTYLDLNHYKKDSEEDAIPLPFIITLDASTRKILAIRRNWKSTDSSKTRTNYFIQYNYLPGFGIYGLGLAHLIGANAITLTTLLRELVDAGKFQNLPGGLRQGGMGQQDNDLIVGPGQFVYVNTGGVDLDKAFMKLPYGEPSATLRELRNEIINQTKELSSMSELGMLSSKEDIPTGTAMAMLENSNRIQSVVLRSIHYSFSQELQLLDKTFREMMEGGETYSYKDQLLDRMDLAPEVVIIPVSDPSSNSLVQRIIRANSILQLALQAPDLHYMREVFKLNYMAHGLEEREIVKILKPGSDQTEKEILPLDPVSENINMLTGLPVMVAKWQDDDAHILVHELWGQQNSENQQLQATIAAHNQEHYANKYLKHIENILGFELPSLDELVDPQIQNAIALGVAQALESEVKQIPPIPTPLDPNAVWLADIEAKKADTTTRERIAILKAESDKSKRELDADVEVFKSQLDFEKETAKIDSAHSIATLKAETELIKHEI